VKDTRRFIKGKKSKESPIAFNESRKSRQFGLAWGGGLGRNSTSIGTNRSLNGKRDEI